MLYIYRILFSVALALIQVGQPWRFPSWVGMLPSLGSHLGDPPWNFPSHRGFLLMLIYQLWGLAPTS